MGGWRPRREGGARPTSSQHPATCQQMIEEKVAGRWMLEEEVGRRARAPHLITFHMFTMVFVDIACFKQVLNGFGDLGQVSPLEF